MAWALGYRKEPCIIRKRALYNGKWALYAMIWGGYDE